MFDRLQRVARLAAWAFTGITIMYFAADALHIAVPHEGAVWVLTGVYWALVVEMKGRSAMCDKVEGSVGTIKKSVATLKAETKARMDGYERRILGHTLAAEEALGCQPKSTDS